MRRWFNSFSVFIAVFLATSIAHCVPKVSLDDIEAKIDSWHLSEARVLFDKLGNKEKTEPKARYLGGKLLFFEGRYAGALAEFRSAIEGARAELDWKILRNRAAKAERIFAKLSIKEGAGGNFVYRFAPGPDSLLVPYADETLEKQLNVLEELFGDRPNFKIEVDLLPDEQSLADVSGLTVEQIERTGTVGVSKYGRVMILTPRRLTTGYPWLDTLAHELTHVTITRVSQNRAPIWLHEGISKLMEQRWRGPDLGVLTPEEAYLLDRAAREGRLIPLRRFHPSIAYMPNQEDAALAYAQVLSFVGYITHRLGEGSAAKLLRRLGEGESIDKALVTLGRFDLAKLYRWWKQLVSGKRQTPVPAVGLLKRRFKHGEATNETGIESLLDMEVRKHLRVGDLLRLRGHVKAAVVEYRSAQARAQSPSPKITDRLAACLLELGEAQAVVEMLPTITELYPVHSTTFIQLGLALAAVGKNTEAVDTLQRANAINPFHPALHCTLAKINEQLGNKQIAALEKEHCRLLAKTEKKKN